MFNKSLWFTTCGIAGFCLACFFLFGTCGKKNSKFHEIGYNPVDIARQMLQVRKDTLSTNVKMLDSIKKTFKKDENPKWQNSIVQKHLKDSLQLLQIDTMYFTGYDDSTRWKKAHKSLRAFIDQDTLLILDKSYHSSSDTATIPVNFAFDDIDITGENSKKEIGLPVKSASNDVDFFSKYPGFGIWAFLIIVFISCVFMSIPYCVSASKQLTELAMNAGCYKPGTYWTCLGVSILLMVVFIGGVILTLYDCDAIKDIFFMRDLRDKIRIISIIGYIGAACCFAGMLSVAVYARCFIDRIPPETEEQKKVREEITLIEKSKDQNREVELEAKREKLRLSKIVTLAETQHRMATEIETLEKSLGAVDLEKKSALEIELSKKKEQARLFELRLAVVVSDYTQLRKIFRLFFYAISLLLALLVFSTGALYSAVDSISFMQLIKKSLGFASARPDFVYLYGALHTLLILLFYLPARFQLAGYLSTDDSNISEEKKSWIKSLGRPMKKIPELLVATAPLLASLMQWVLSLVFGE